MESSATPDTVVETIAERLSRRPQLASLVAALLHAAGPLTFLGAQALYLSQPVLGALLPGEKVRALAQALEDPARVQALASQLEAKVA